jgi:pimeloyl-ACP methyl ester carboxylesterase
VARHLAGRYRVLCPDTLGRGLSSWARDPEAEYRPDVYARHAAAILDQLGIAVCDWVGTSMGGLVAMCGAVGPLGGRIRRLVLNDIGPEINPAAIERIRGYATVVPRFPGVLALERFLREVNRPMGWMSDEEWRRIAEASARRLDDGSVGLHYDPAAMRVFAQAEVAPLWAVWDTLDLPVLLLRGVESDILLPSVAQAMTVRGPCAALVELPGCGHAPMLNVPAQIAPLDAFLAG